MIILYCGVSGTFSPQKAKNLVKVNFAVKRLMLSLFSLLAVETLYKKVGDDVVLQPVNPPVTKESITWKDGSNLAVEWEGQKIEYLRQYEGM